MGSASILVVDDDPKIRGLLRNVLEGEGFCVQEAADAKTALKQAAADIDLITLDIQLGTDDGFDVAREIRKTSRVPIVMVTGKDDVIDRVVGLELGADDYITKPFHVREVIARVRSVLRRTEMVNPAGQRGDTTHVNRNAEALAIDSLCFQFDELTAIPDRLELRDRGGQQIPLTSGEFKLLAVFLERPKRVLSRDQLMDLTGGVEWSPLDRTVDNQVARLRKKIEREPSEPKLIKTVRGIGYTFACEVKVVDQSSLSKSA